MKIVVEKLVRGTAQRVWSAYTLPEDIVHWNAASDDWHTPRATVDLRVGGKFCSRMEARDGSFGFDFEGVYTRVEPEKLIEYEFGGRIAQVDFVPADGGILVRVSFDAEDENSLDQQKDGWQSILNNFARHVESAS